MTIVDVFWICVVILGSGWLYFFVVRPILEAWGLVGPLESVKDIDNKRERAEQNTLDVMSNSAGGAYPSVPSLLRTDGRTDDGRTETTAQSNRLTEDQLLTLYSFLRRLGATRDDTNRVLKASGIPMNNNLWTRAAPLDDDVMLTPIAGRPTRAAYYESDLALQYQEPPK